MSNTYDATKLKEKGKELTQRISDDVNAHENFIIGAIPDVLKITKEQYKELAGLEAFENMMDYNAIMDELKPDEDKKMFFTQEKVNAFGKRSGGYILEVQIKE